MFQILLQKSRTSDHCAGFRDHTHLEIAKLRKYMRPRLKTHIDNLIIQIPYTLICLKTDSGNCGSTTAEAKIHSRPYLHLCEYSQSKPRKMNEGLQTSSNSMSANMLLDASSFPLRKLHFCQIFLISSTKNSASIKKEKNRARIQLV